MTGWDYALAFFVPFLCGAIGGVVFASAQAWRKQRAYRAEERAWARFTGAVFSERESR